MINIWKLKGNAIDAEFVETFEKTFKTMRAVVRADCFLKCNLDLQINLEELEEDDKEFLQA